MPSALNKFSPVKTLIIIFILILLCPIATIALYLFQPNTDVWQHLIDTVLTDYVVNSVVLCIGVTLLAGLLGISTAWLTTNYKFPTHKILPVFLMLPLAMPAYIIAFTYTGMLESGGIIQHYLRQYTGLSYGQYWFPEIRNMYGAIIMLGFVLYPYVFLTCRASFLTQSSHALQVGQTLGLNPTQRFLKIALPLSRPAIVAGSALVIMETLADYGTVQYFGVNTFTTGIFRTWFGLDDLGAAVNLSAMLLFFVLLILGIEKYSRKKTKYAFKTFSVHQTNKQTPSNGLKIMILCWCWFPVLIGFFIPCLQLGYWAFSNLEAVNKEFLLLCWNSFYLALLTAVITVAITFLIYAYNRNAKSKMVNFSFKIAGLGYAIPGIVIAIGVLIPAAELDKLINIISQSLLDKSVGLIFSGSIAILIFAYLIRFVAVALGNIESGFSKISLHIDEAALSLKTSHKKLFTQIHSPLMIKVLLTSTLIIFVDVLKELPSTLVLRPFNFNTLAVKAFELASDEFLIEAALPSIFIILTGIIPVIILNYGINKSHGNQ